jgi:hypothetical protein
MAPMRAARLALAAGCLLAAAASLAGCGGDSDTGESTPKPAEEAESRPAPASSEFPSSRGRSLGALLELADDASELVLTPAAKVFYRGPNRYPFGVVERDGTQISDAEVALYLARVPTPRKGKKVKPGGKGPLAKAQLRALEEPAIGPFPAAIESLTAEPAFRGEAPAGLDRASVVYSTGLEFPSDGEWRIAALIKEGDRLSARWLPSAMVGEFHRVPRPGERAPRIHTPVPADVGGERSKITTRVPPDTQNEVDYAQALGKRPIVLLFATPKFCQSRVCGPVVDVAEQAKREYGDEAAFIHMEIYKDNDPSKGVRPQVRAFHLPSEPWLFTIDRDGVIDSAIEGAFGPELLTGAVERVVAG